MRLLALVPTFALLAATSDGIAVDFDAGRVLLRVTDDGWVSVATSSDDLPFPRGNRGGTIEVATRSFVLVDDANRFRAALVVRATRGVPVIDVKWPADCRSQDNVYAVDAGQGGTDGRDCLRVTGLVAIERSLATDAPAVATDLAKRRVIAPTAGYVVLDEVALGNGAFVSIEALLAADVELPGGATAQQSLPAGINAEIVGWGQRLAEAARSSIHSLSGLLVVPPLKPG
ncbi:MAG TPA: hypothetical protein VFJ68_04505 [Casimicrobiaceae bacterium]|nr:hypothetical protein [Casimicrobiaceae bacterium]